MAIKLAEHTDGTHIYMRLRLDNKRIEEIDFPKPEIRAQIIKAFHELY